MAPIRSEAFQPGGERCEIFIEVKKHAKNVICSGNSCALQVCFNNRTYSRELGRRFLSYGLFDKVKVYL